jgi:hypothetical protein
MPVGRMQDLQRHVLLLHLCHSRINSTSSTRVTLRRLVSPLLDVSVPPLVFRIVSCFEPRHLTFDTVNLFLYCPHS